MKKKFVYIISLIILAGCANKASKELDIEASEAPEMAIDDAIISEEDAYTMLITQKLQEYLDKKALAEIHPGFDVTTDQDGLLSDKAGTEIREIKFIEPFKIISDSVKTVKTAVVLDSKIDTLITHIKTSETEIDGEKLKTTNISFELFKKPEKPSARKPNLQQSN